MLLDEYLSFDYHISLPLYLWPSTNRSRPNILVTFGRKNSWVEWRGGVHYARLGLGTEFHSEKIPQNRLGTVSVIPQKKVLIPRYSEFRGRANSEARNGTEFREIMKFKGKVYILNKISFKQGGGNQFLRPLQELSIWVLSETAAAAFCSELFSLMRNGSERNSENLHLFWFHGKVIPYLQCQPTKWITNNT